MYVFDVFAVNMQDKVLGEKNSIQILVSQILVHQRKLSLRLRVGDRVTPVTNSRKPQPLTNM